MASSSMACRACQRTILEAFTSLTGLSINATRAPRPRLQTLRPAQLSRPSTRAFQTSAFRLQEQHSQDTEIATSSRDDALPSTSTPPEPTLSVPTTTSENASIPWYLRVETPTPPAPVSSHLASQELPPLPDNSPEILSPILHHLSISIGLDNLTLLDLRDLSPPSALGANLLMIIGTARSHKHLNTSADRFCRWLRSTYKLRPYADGLLGRNELKLKLRRRNRRMKLAQSVGNTTAFAAEDGSGGYDSGITTGWICCNLGAVDAAVLPGSSNGATIEVAEDGQREEQPPPHVVLSSKDQERILEDEEAEYTNPGDEDFKYRGFGSVTNSPMVVVQMFTEEKRLEMDLEGLWETRIMRRERKEQRQDQLFETSKIEDEVAGERPTMREGLGEAKAV